MGALKPARKLPFVLVWGVLAWGGGTAFLTSVVDWRTGRHLQPLILFARCVIFLSLGLLMGLLLWNKLQVASREKTTRNRTVARFLIFVAVMLGLIYALAVLSNHKSPSL